MAIIELIVLISIFYFFVIEFLLIFKEYIEIIFHGTMALFENSAFFRFMNREDYHEI
jgi:hypothetical protein